MAVHNADIARVVGELTIDITRTLAELEPPVDAAAATELGRR